jgi:hypothetical protein
MTKTYLVTISDRYPAAGECPTVLEIDAANKKAAIAQARKLVGWRSRHDSPLTYRAAEA